MTSLPVATSTSAQSSPSPVPDDHLPKSEQMSANASSLKSWFKDQINGLYSLHSSSESEGDASAPQKAFEVAFDGTFADKALIRVNGDDVDLPKFKDSVSASGFAATSSQVDWADDVKVEEDSNGGTISGSYTLTRTLKFRIRAAPAVRKSRVNFVAKVEAASSAPESSNASRWRIVSLTETTEDITPPIRFATAG
ncbi:hypothetical protein HGRIS_001679 [Hohenbuehelia grisea]